ncbi:O-antigen ligase family protein [Flavobacterium nitrogenifigens]|uniref:O-Antigen ligase n=1 Tax=Flavobacterium nitrogenifigens TaxID=1617283 RepID=A0A521EE83_9FLAO|nr:O-antigen ligase family protein [Flavobacterium nitrogenifigens]KAF2325967.1 O-antigen ligase family protein [Flavobacterium nitrogenifigens]SMO82218.1 O-Antigen ligase [Flavobacterium nitrogenifigens]
MKNIKFNYTLLIILHIVIAFAVFVLPFLSKIYAFLIPIIGAFFVFKNKNKNNEVLYVSAYLVGVEVFLRMTEGNFNNEYVKYLVIFFMICGMIFSNFSKNAFIYSFFLILLLPAVLITTETTNFDINIRKILAFNLSGPFCLAICATYMINRKIVFNELQNILKSIGFPIITTTIYLFLYTPSIKEVVTGTQSNFATSGGFGPNQVSTILGLGIFVFFTQLILFSKTKKDIFINGSLLIFISYRGIVTFSRGGVFTAIAMIICLFAVVYYFSNARGKSKFIIVFVLTGLMSIAIWTYSSLQTHGLIEKRYANKDARGREKKDRLGGREEVMNAEINLFLNNPIFGVGAGMSKYERVEELGQEVASHSEITRLGAEHGVFGVFAFLILFFTPIVSYKNNKQHLYFLSFFIFWLLTINHAAMRIAAPAFVYALCLLSVQIKIPEETQN